MSRELSIKNTGISSSITLAIAAQAKKMKAAGVDIIDFGVGEPDFKTPDSISKAAIKAIEEGKTGYTDASGLPELKRAICDKFQSDNHLNYLPENIVVSNGAKHSIFNALQAVCNPGDEVLIPVPYWVSYPELVKLADATPVFVMTSEKEGFMPDKQTLLSCITPKTKAIIINSPNNPTGAVYSREVLENIAAVAVEHSLYVISDEIYEKLTYGTTHTSIASLGEDIKNLTITVNGMSKCYAMPGWRIGYTAANTQITRVMSNIQSHATSNPNTIAQYAGIEALRGSQDPVRQMWTHFFNRRDYMVSRINAMDLVSCTKPDGAFYVMVNISRLTGKRYKDCRINSALDFTRLLLEEAKIAAVPGEGFGVENFARFSYATSLEMIASGLDRLETFLQHLN